MTEFKLPELGENVHQGDLVRLMISPGANVTEGQAVMELETDKAVVEVPSSLSGTVKEVRVKQGEKVKVGQVIFTIENGAKGKPAPEAVPATAKESNGAGREINAEPDSSEVHEDRPEPVRSESKKAPEKSERKKSAKAKSGSEAAADPSSEQALPGATDFKLPELGENITQGDLVRLMVSSGDKVSEGQPVMELETDKAVIEVPSSVSGVIKDVQVKARRKNKSWPGYLYASSRVYGEWNSQTSAGGTCIGTECGPIIFSGSN